MRAPGERSSAIFSPRTGPGVESDPQRPAPCRPETCNVQPRETGSSNPDPPDEGEANAYCQGLLYEVTDLARLVGFGAPS
jgi:hypothetical protein